jgi:acyl transferase domain-containing protein
LWEHLVQPTSALESDIAIIGLSGRFPGAPSIVEFWRNLRDGVESIVPLGEEELLRAGIDRSTFEQPEYVRAHAPLEGVELFDAAFFEMTPREAAMVDPQQRVFLECAWETLEVAGYNPGCFRARIGIFGGSGMNTYLLRNVLSNPDTVEPDSHFSIAVANDKDYLTTRVAYKLNLLGPAITVQTACSTSLVAVHQACQSLLNGECEMALAGGVAVRVPQTEGYTFYEGGIVSPDGHCRAFDRDARGTVFGSGVGLVLLKRLEAARADGDTIYAVIKGSAVNNDGSLKAGFTAPNVDRQAEVVAEAQAIGGVSAENIGYVEAHGTGTPMGDPIEVTALTRAFRLGTQASGFCALGSVKTNVGHLDTAAGITGLIKTILALRHRQIPPSLHFRVPNPQIDWENSPFFVSDRLADWPARDGVRRAGVSSFGIGGTNAHVVLEEAPAVMPTTPSQPWQLLLLSARTTTALDAATLRLGEHLREHKELELADVSYTMQMGRRAFDQRRFAVCADLADARSVLTEAAPAERLISSGRRDGQRRVIFMFPGQGSQYVRMGWDLYQSEQTFRGEIDACAEILRPHLGLDLREVLYPPDDGRVDEMTAKLTETWLAQPAIFMVSYALAKLWMSWGVRPQAMIGHSIGEYVAACLAGVFSRDDALALVAARGRMMQDVPRGAMMTVSLPEAEVRSLLNEALSVAAVNGPERCVVSGATAEVAELERRLSDREIACRRLHTSHAFHSRMMDGILDRFEAHVSQVRLRRPEIPYLSNVTGNWIRPEDATDPRYWSRHLREIVRFGDGLHCLMSDSDAVLLEVGAGRTLCTFALQQQAGSSKPVAIQSLRHSQDEGSDRAFLLTALGRLWGCGVEVDWAEFWRGQRRMRVSLPTYPFERKRYWIEPGKSRASGPRPAGDIADWIYVPSWRRTAPRMPLAQSGARRWLLFIDEYGIGARMAERLVAAGDTVATVTIGSRFSIARPGSYTIDPTRSGDYAKVLDDLRNAGITPTHIVHLWSVGALGAARETDRGLFSLLALAQAIGNRDAQSLQLYVVSSGLHAVTGGEPEKATILGPCQVIPREYSQVTCVNVDVEVDLNVVDRLVDQLLAEVSNPVTERTVAYRGPHRWVQTFDKIELPAASAAKTGWLRELGTYLITGGLGGLGLHIAEMLARTARAYLALVGRSEFPARDQWDAWLIDHDDADSISQTIRRLRSIETEGSEVLIVQADVADRESMARAIDRTRARFGKIHGVIHAAGIAGGGMIQGRTPQQCAAVLAPKLQGARILRELLKHDPPEVMVLCSSIEAICGSFGQVDYCAANCFLDVFAYESTYREGMPTVSVNWDRWHETGMAAPKSRSLKRGLIHPLLGARSSTNAQVFESTFRPEELWVLSEHRIFEGISVAPGTAFLEMARAAVSVDRSEAAIEFADVLFVQPLIIPDGHSRVVQTTLQAEAGATSFCVRSREASDVDAPWLDHAVGQITSSVHERSGNGRSKPRVEAMIRDLNLKETPISAAQQDQIRQHGLGPRWATVKQVFAGPSDAIALIELPEACAGDLKFMALHPALLDTAIGFANWHVGGEGTFLPVSYDRIRVHAPLPARFYSHVRFAAAESGSPRDSIRYDVHLIDAHDGLELVDIEGVVFRRVDSNAMATPLLRAKNNGDAGSGGAKQGFTGMRPEDGVEVLRRIMVRGILPQIIVSMRDPADVIEAAGRAGAPELAQELGSIVPARVAAAQTRPDLRTRYVAPEQGNEAQLAAIWAELLGVDRVGRNDNFFELGGDSVVGIQMIAKAHHAGIRLTPQQLFRHQTVAALAEAAGGHARPGTSVQVVATHDKAGDGFALSGLDGVAMQTLAQQIEAADE